MMAMANESSAKRLNDISIQTFRPEPDVSIWNGSHRPLLPY
jgi:hypothetical protein